MGFVFLDHASIGHLTHSVHLSHLILANLENPSTVNDEIINKGMKTGIKLKIINLTYIILKFAPVLRIFIFFIPNTYIYVDNFVEENSKISNSLDFKHCSWYVEDEIKPATLLIGQDLSALKVHKVTTKATLLDIRDNSFSFRNNHLLDRYLNVIGEYRSEDKEKLRPLPIYSNFLELPGTYHGTVAYLSDPAPQNYYHWMCRTLPLIKIYQKFIQLSEIDFFYVGNFRLSKFHIESLSKIGIPLNKIIQKACTADRLLIAVTDRSKHISDPINDPINREFYDFTKNLFVKSNKSERNGERKRIYIQRGNVKGRNVRNEEAILELIREYDFEPISMDGKTISEQAKLFSNSEAIIAPHGAALTNLVFVQPNTKVIELSPLGYTNNCYYVIASYSKANYFFLQGEPTCGRVNDSRDIDIHIDLTKLKSVLREAML